MNCTVLPNCLDKGSKEMALYVRVFWRGKIKKKKKKGFTYRKRFSMNIQVQNESLRLGQEILDLHL